MATDPMFPIMIPQGLCIKLDSQRVCDSWKGVVRLKRLKMSVESIERTEA